MNRAMSLVFLVYYGYPSPDICAMFCLETNKKYKKTSRSVYQFNN